MRRPIRLLCALALPLAFANAASAQTMQQRLNSLFLFSGSSDPLFLGGSAGVPATQAHGTHFIPSESQGNLVLLDFFDQSIGRNIANFPLSSTVASQTFSFVNGVPTPSSSSFGPVFAERGQTLGRGRINAGMNVSRVRFSRLRGVPLNDVELNFTHQNVNFPNCDSIFKGSCSLYGIPIFEHDVINLKLDLSMQADVYAIYSTFGLTDWLDVGIAVPIVDMSFQGSSLASIIPAEGVPVAHFFGGTPTNPVLTADRQSFGRTTGIGDVAARIKARIFQGNGLAVGLLGEVRAPTGREEDFLGTGKLSAQGMFIASGTFSGFSPHMNAGYSYRGGALAQNTVDLIAGFDQRVAPWATFAVDLLGNVTVGQEKVTFPAPVTIPAPYPQTVQLTNIPNRRDDIMNGSIGFKFRSPAGFTFVANVIVPLNEGGLRANAIPTIGFEYATR